MSKWNRARLIAAKVGKTVLKGEFVLKLDRFLPHILVIVGIFTLCIYLNLRMDQTMVAREKGRVALERAKVCYYQKVCSLAELEQVNAVEQRLLDKGSLVAPPQKPAKVLD